MDLPLSVRGFLLGLSIAAVLGPIGLLCVRRTLAGGFADSALLGMAETRTRRLECSVNAGIKF